MTILQLLKQGIVLYPEWCLGWENERLRPFVCHSFSARKIVGWDGFKRETFPVTNQGVEDAVKFAFKRQVAP